MHNRYRKSKSNINNRRSEIFSIPEYFTLFCICLFVGILIGLYGYYQNKLLPSHIMLVACLTYILPAYSLVGVAFRFRNAVVTTRVALLVLLLTDSINAIYIYVKDEGISLLFVMEIIICLMWVYWIVFFFKSKAVDLYFPNRARTIFDFDGRLLVAALGLCLILNSSMIDYIKRLNDNQKEYPEIVGKSSQIRSFNNSLIRYWGCTIEREEVCNVYFKLDDKSVTRKDFYQYLERPYFPDELLNAVDSEAPDFLRSVFDHNLALVFNVFYKDLADRRVFNIHSGMIDKLLDPESKEVLTPGKMKMIRESLLEILPPAINKNITLVSLERLNEINVIAVYEVDENKEKYVDAFKEFQTFSEEISDLLKKKTEENNHTLLKMRKMEVALKFILRGSNTGYEETIRVF